MTKTILLLLILFGPISQVYSVDIAKDSLIYYSLSEDIGEQDFSKYLKVKNYIEHDSLTQNRELYFSEYLVDLDRFWFLEDLNNFPCLKKKIEYLSKNKFKWFEDYYSKNLHQLWGVQNSKAKSILFFSKIEENTLRVDLFLTKNHPSYFKYDQLTTTPMDKVFAYLFFFNEEGEIHKVFCKEIIYGI